MLTWGWHQRRGRTDDVGGGDRRVEDRVRKAPRPSLHLDEPGSPLNSNPSAHRVRPSPVRYLNDRIRAEAGEFSRNGRSRDQRCQDRPSDVLIVGPTAWSRQFPHVQLKPVPRRPRQRSGDQIAVSLGRCGHGHSIDPLRTADPISTQGAHEIGTFRAVTADQSLLHLGRGRLFCVGGGGRRSSSRGGGLNLSR